MALSEGSSTPLTHENFDAMLAYMVKKTILEDDGTHRRFKVGR